MHFRYRNARGKTMPLPDVASLIEAIQTGEVTAETQLAVGDDGDWQPAESVAAYREAAAMLARSAAVRPARGAVPIPAPPAAPVPAPPWIRRRNVRIGAVVVAAGLIVLLAGLRIRYLGRAEVEAQRRAALEAVRLARVGQEARPFVVLAADSGALLIRALQDWVNRQGFDQRLRGAALQNPAGLRAVRASAAAYRAQVDGVIANNRKLSARLLTRADSQEGAEPALDGLRATAEGELAGWVRDLQGWAELERGVAATLDSVAAFLPGVQGGFVLVDGQAVFLSRADGARFRQLHDHFADLAEREASWARDVRARRPDWMAALPEATRPRFGEALLRGP